MADHHFAHTKRPDGRRPPRLVYKGRNALARASLIIRLSCKSEENKSANERTRTAYLISSYEKQSAGLGVSMVVAQVVCPSPSIYGMGVRASGKEWFAVVEWFGRPKIETDEVRERRITMEAVVDAYDEQERAIGWYYYLEGKLDFPFLARSAIRRSTSPLKVGDEVEVIGMAPVEECEHDMFVEMDWDEEELAIPLSQLEVVDADDETREAVEDWLYWTKKGYQF
jgi:hypothetical protein